jgi:lipopolysaccharide biosynthesis glycosyltransferase
MMPRATTPASSWVDTSRRIAIAMATDDTYAPQTGVALYSVLRELGSDVVCTVYLLTPKGFRRSNKNTLDRLVGQFSNAVAVFIEMQEGLRDAKVTTTHLSSVCYYRLLLPEVLPDETKCLYLDADIVAKQDISELFALELGDAYVAGVKAAAYHYPEELASYHRERLGIADMSTYINSGVLLMNLAKMREDQLVEAFRELAPKAFASEDQDIVNVACYGRIQILQPKYNAMTKYHLTGENTYDTDPCLTLCYSRKEWDEARKAPVLIHFADRYKPWTDLDTELSELWWRYLEQVGFAPETVAGLLEKAIVANREKLVNLREQVIESEQQYRWIAESTSYRVGRLITWIPGVIKDRLSRP